MSETLTIQDKEFRVSDYQLIVSDLDGTLLRDDHTLSDYAKKTLRSLIKIGKKIVLASARPPASVYQIASSIDSNIAAISFNGACAQFCGKDNFDLSWEFDISNIVKAIAVDDSFAVHVFSQNDWFAFGNKKLIAQEIKDVGYGPKVISSFADLSDNYSANKILLQGDPHEISSLHRALIDIKGVNMAFAKAGYLDITSNKADKWNALSLYSSLQGIKAKNIMAFGDGENDIQMLSNSAFGIAPKNATDKVKAVSNKIIGNNDNDAVASFLNKVFLS